jgi:trk system potassium uptake protein TrkH
MLFIVYRYTFLIVLFSFLLFGFIGAGLLFLPGVSELYSISFLDALFISFSAICGGGVSLYPISGFSLFGKIVLMLIMYVGSIGILTCILGIISYFSFYNAESYGLAREILNIIQIKKIGSFLKIIFLGSSLFLFLGTISYLLLSYAVKTPLSLIDASFIALNFFTNIGFEVSDIGGEALLMYSAWYVISILLMFFGAIGFLFFFELQESFKRKYSKMPYSFSLTTKVMVSCFFGTLFFMWCFYFIVCENNFSFISLVRSLFAAISFRSCGISPYKNLPTAIIFISSLYGILGTTPFGTGGGIKTSLLGILLKTPCAIFKKSNYLTLFFKKIPWRIVALAHIFLLYCIGISAFLTIIIACYTGNNIDFMLIYSDILGFVTGSGTLWSPLVAMLGHGGKICCIILMAFGKISGIILTLYATKTTQSRKQYPEGNLILL